MTSRPRWHSYNFLTNNVLQHDDVCSTRYLCRTFVTRACTYEYLPRMKNQDGHGVNSMPTGSKTTASCEEHTHKCKHTLYINIQSKLPLYLGTPCVLHSACCIAYAAACGGAIVLIYLVRSKRRTIHILYSLQFLALQSRKPLTSAGVVEPAWSTKPAASSYWSSQQRTGRHTYILFSL